MKAKDVLKILQISRSSLTHYLQDGRLKGKRLQNGFYDYDEDSVLSLAGFVAERKCVIYARVSTQKQKKSLERQIRIATEYANVNGFKVDKVYSDIASGLSYDRGEFQQLLDDVLHYRVKTIFVTEKDRLTRVSFNMWKELFARFCCELRTVNNTDGGDEEADKEIFSDIISLLHCFAMKMYSARRGRKLKLMSDDLSNEADV